MGTGRGVSNLAAWCAAGLFVLLLFWPVCAFGQERRDGSAGDLDAETRHQVLEGVVGALQSFYVAPEAVPRIEQYLRHRLRGGAYDRAVTPAQIAQALTEDLKTASHSTELAVVHTSEKERDHLALGTRKVASAFHRLEMLPGNVGYLDLPDRVDADLTQADAKAAMEALAKADAVILDTRHNRGGSFPALHLLTSYFFPPQPIELYFVHTPRMDRRTPAPSLARLPGKRLRQEDVYILTTRKTVAPILVLQQFRRGKIVGEPTVGGAQLFRSVAVGNGFLLWLSEGELLHSDTHERWEGKSVEPDIAVPAERALSMAHFEAVKRLAAKASDPVRKRQLEWLLPVLELAARGTKEAPAALLQAYAGRYASAEVLLEQGHLVLLDDREVRRKLIPLPGEGFLVEDTSVPPENQIRVRFIRNARGSFHRLQILSPDGRTNSRYRRGAQTRPLS